MPRPKRRKRSPHPGIVRLPARPEKRQAESIRYRDPEDPMGRRFKTEKIPDSLPNEAAVRDWLKRRAQELAERRAAIQYRGAPRATGTALESAIADFFSESAIRDTTAAMYKFSTGPFLRWAAQAQPPVKSGDELTLARLREFRAWTMRRHRAGSPHTINRDLRTIAAILEHSRKAGRCAFLTRDAIADGLERLPARVDRRPFLEAVQVRELVIAARETEPEIAPWIVFALLTGMRRIETLGLEWRDVSDHEIYVRPEITKPGCARAVDLAVCPGLQIKNLTPMSKSRLFDLTPDQIREAQRRLIAAGAPKFSPHMLRRTCGTFLACAPGIWGAASVFMTARQLGHSVAIAEKHYLGRAKISSYVRTLEDAMGIADLLGHNPRA